jgi:phosphate transport system protein
MEAEIDENCQRILATRGPTASDLRAVLAIHKSTGDFERIGDESKKIALIAAQLTAESVRVGKYREIRHLAQVVQQMLFESLQAYARLDAAAAVRTMRMDRAIDAEYEAIQRQCVTYMMEDRQLIQRALDDMWTVRALERIGDHAKNVCEYIVYVVHGEDIRHSRHSPPAAQPLAT